MMDIIKAILPHAGALVRLIELIISQRVNKLDPEQVKSEIEIIKQWAADANANEWGIVRNDPQP